MRVTIDRTPATPPKAHKVYVGCARTCGTDKTDTTRMDALSYSPILYGYHGNSPPHNTQIMILTYVLYALIATRGEATVGLAGPDGAAGDVEGCKRLSLLGSEALSPATRAAGGLASEAVTIAELVTLLLSLPIDQCQSGWLWSEPFCKASQGFLPERYM